MPASPGKPSGLVLRCAGVGGSSLPRLGPTVPYWLLLVAALAAGGTATLLLTESARAAGLTLLVSAAALQVTRRSARRVRDRRAEFGGRLLERVLDASVLLPLAWVARSTDALVALLALVGLGAAFVAAYERARATSLGFRVHQAAWYRILLSAVLAVGLLGGWLEGALWTFAALALGASIVRARDVARQHARDVAGRAAA